MGSGSVRISPSVDGHRSGTLKLTQCQSVNSLTHGCIYETVLKPRLFGGGGCSSLKIGDADGERTDLGRDNGLAIKSFHLRSIGEHTVEPFSAVTGLTVTFKPFRFLR